MHETTPDGTAFVRSGPDTGIPVVLIHGLGLNRHVWQWMIPALADRYQMLAYDLYGHGDSANPPSKPSLKLFSQQLAGLMDHCGMAEAVIVGFSLGGMICRRFAQDHPKRTLALGILNSPHKRTPQAQAAIVRRVEQAAQDGPAATVEAALERWFTDAYRAANPQMMDLVRSWVLANDPAIYPLNYKVLADGIDEITSSANRLQIPALVLTGDEDFGNGPDMTHAIADGIAGGEALILPGLRHMALAEAPEAVNTPLRAFLDRVTTS